MSQTRPKTPEPVRRALRQEAGFGCCICGLPILEYHHIIPWKERHHFEPEHMMALCPNCHDACGDEGKYSQAEQYVFKAQPTNISKGLVQGNLTTEPGALIMGGGNFFAEGFQLVVDKEVLFCIQFEDERPVISGKIYDQSDTLLVELEENEWTSVVDIPWDIQSKYRYLKIQQKQRGIYFTLDARNATVRVEGKLYRSGHAIIFNDQKFGMETTAGGGMTFSGSVISYFTQFFIDTKTQICGFGEYPSDEDLEKMDPNRVVHENEIAMFRHLWEEQKDAWVLTTNPNPNLGLLVPVDTAHNHTVTFPDQAVWRVVVDKMTSAGVPTITPEEVDRRLDAAGFTTKE